MAEVLHVLPRTLWAPEGPHDHGMLGDPEVLLEAPWNPGAPEASAVEKTPRTHAQVYQGELGACLEAPRRQVEERGALTETGPLAQQP